MKNNLMKWILAGILQLGMTHAAMGMEPVTGVVHTLPQYQIQNMNDELYDDFLRAHFPQQYNGGPNIQHNPGTAAEFDGLLSTRRTNTQSIETPNNENNPTPSAPVESSPDLRSPPKVSRGVSAGYIALGALAVVGLVYGSYKLVKYFKNKNTDKPAPAN